MTTFRQECHDLDDILVVNRPLQVIFQKEKNKYVYKSSIADFNKNTISITPLTRDGKPAQLRNGEHVSAVYFGTEAMYEFKTHVTGHQKENKVMLTLLEKPHACDRVQRREFYRLPCTIKAQYRTLGIQQVNEKRKFVPTSQYTACVINDISGGGVSLYVGKELEDASYIEIICELPMGAKKAVPIKEVVTVLREKKVNPLDHKGDLEFAYGAGFLSIAEEKQTDIIRYIMWRQIEARKIEKSKEEQK